MPNFRSSRRRHCRPSHKSHGRLCCPVYDNVEHHAPSTGRRPTRSLRPRLRSEIASQAFLLHAPASRQRNYREPYRGHARIGWKTLRRYAALPATAPQLWTSRRRLLRAISTHQNAICTFPFMSTRPSLIFYVCELHKTRRRTFIQTQFRLRHSSWGHRKAARSRYQSRLPAWRECPCVLSLQLSNCRSP